MSHHTRRSLLAALGTTGVVGLAGCSSGRLGTEWPETVESTTDPLPGEDDGWPQFGRTAGHTGFAPEVRIDDPEPVWTVAFPGGLSSPVGAGDRLFVQTASGPETDGAGTVVALDTDGGERWRRELPSGGGGWSGCPPILHRGSVYVGGVGGVYAIDARDGTPRWGRETHEQPGNLGYDAVALGGRIYVPVLWDFTLDRESGGTLVALGD